MSHIFLCIYLTDVSGSKCDEKLLSFVALGPGFGHDVFV